MIKHYRAVHNLVVPPESKGFFVHRGWRLDRLATPQTWIPVHEEKVAVNEIIQANSEFEGHLSPHRERVWVHDLGAVISPEEKRHFDLAAVLGDRVNFVGRETPLEEVFHFHGIYTLEDVLADSKGRTLTGFEITAHELLATYYDKETRERLLQSCADYVKEN